MSIHFGTDGWRGVMGRDFTFPKVRLVAQAIAEHLKAGSGLATVLIGHDSRFFSDRFAMEMGRVLAANGLKTRILQEILPTPAVSLAVHKLQASLGVVITASHNPPEYNGIKLKGPYGGSLTEADTQPIEERIAKAHPLTDGARPEFFSFKSRYKKHLTSLIRMNLIVRSLKRPVAIDCMHGNAGFIFPEILPQKKRILLRHKSDPLFGGIRPEPIEENLEELKKTVRAKRALAGLALDGDADRLAVIDEKGNYLTPCLVYPLLLHHLLENRKLKGRILSAASMGYLPQRMAAAYHLPFQEVPVGFKYIAQEMRRGDVLMGGEESGSFGFGLKGNIPERDGVLSGLLFLELLAASKKKPSQLLEALQSRFGKSFYLRRDIHIRERPPEKKPFTEKLAKKLPKKIAGYPVREVRTLDGIKIILQEDFWLLMRSSGTEPLIRTYAETDRLKKTQELLAFAEKLCRNLI
ncbi:MAG: phosphoglucomutase/phosphomannomutase family protein [Elusimicrobia bacterium]|nr:phosphoglucomutase/phosphomannomutase family protein [Elusimicrobiota bacterium]